MNNIERARIIAAAICEADGCDTAYCQFMRDGAYDEEREVRIAHAALLYAGRTAKIAHAALAVAG